MGIQPGIATDGTDDWSVAKDMLGNSSTAETDGRTGMVRNGASS